MESAENISEEIEQAEKCIQRWGGLEERKEQIMIFDGDRIEVDQYLQAVDEIQRSMDAFTVFGNQHKSTQTTIQIAMARLEDEFHHILITHTNQTETDSVLISSSSSKFRYPSSRIKKSSGDFSFEEEEEEEEHEEDDDPEHKEQNTGHEGEGSTSTSYRSTSGIHEIDLIPEEAINDLHSIAKRMISAGYLRECLHVYGSIRKPAIEASLRHLKVEKLSISDIQKLEWDVLEVKIRRWIRAATVCVRVLFASEKRLCEQIFEDSADESCFVEIVKSPAVQLLNFADAISISNRAPERLFKILDLHDSLSDLLPDIEQVFESNLLESIRIQASEILSRLADAARGIVIEFEDAVQQEPSKVPVPGGTIHPLTRYVMNYISLISDYKQTLIELIVSNPITTTTTTSTQFSSSVTDQITTSETENRSPLALHLIWIILNLQVNMEEKSKHYKDPSLPHLFLMNNIHYILHKVKESPELQEMIGDDYLKKLSGKVRQSATSYQRSTWMRILYCLRDEGLHTSGSFSSGVSKKVLRERFKTFNSIFEEVHRTQVTWVVRDIQLREELRISITENVIPAYRSFLGRFRSIIENERHPEMYIKYSVEDIENAILDFFEGHQISLNSRRR